jgi:hypothetical protein
MADKEKTVQQCMRMRKSMVEKLDFLSNVTRIPKSVLTEQYMLHGNLEEDLIKYNFSKARESVGQTE